MGISKLTYNLKGEVIPKWLFDEYALVSIGSVEGCGKNYPSFHAYVT
jgi:hypothetical protein